MSMGWRNTLMSWWAMACTRMWISVKCLPAERDKQQLVPHIWQCCALEQQAMVKAYRSIYISQPFMTFSLSYSPVCTTKEYWKLGPLISIFVVQTKSFSAHFGKGYAQDMTHQIFEGFCPLWSKMLENLRQLFVYMVVIVTLPKQIYLIT